MQTENQVENQEVVEVIVEKTGIELMLETLVKNELDPSHFYCITVRQYGISYQGNFNSNIVKDLIQKDYSHRINSAGYIELTKGAIEVTLT